MKKEIAMFAALLTLQSIEPAFAETSDRVKFSGFGTVGGVWSDSDESDFRSRLEHVSGAGRSHARDTGVDTLFGVQADIAMADRLSSTVQLQSRRLSDGSADPYVEWANLKYRINPNLDVRAGRIVTPMFMVSDTRAVGYSNTAVRLPQGVYVTNPITVVDGGDIT